MIDAQPRRALRLRGAPPRHLASLIGLLAFGLLPREGDAADSPPGAFTLAEGGTRVAVSSWGPDCGPRPADQRDGGGPTYALTATGALTAPRDAPPLFGPGVCRAATGLPDLDEQRAGDVFRCRARAGAARQVEGRVSLRAPDANTLEVRHQFTYDWRLKGSHCAVEVQGRWRLRRAEPILAPDAAAPPPACAAPGPPATLEARGSRRRAVKAEGRIALAARALDAAGCPVAAAPSYEASEGAIDAAGVLDVRGVAAGRTITVTARLADQAVEFRVRVVGDADYSALAAETPALVEGELAPLPPQAGAGLGADSSAPTERGDLTTRILLALFIGFAIVAVGLGVWVTLRTLRARRATLFDDDALARLDAASQGPAAADPVPPDPEPLPAQATAPLGSGVGTGAPRWCPTCERSFGEDTRFCPFDGTTLEEVAAGASEADAPAVAGGRPRERVCPDCGRHYPEDVLFCGVDGARLVLLN